MYMVPTTGVLPSPQPQSYLFLNLSTVPQKIAAHASWGIPSSSGFWSGADCKRKPNDKPQNAVKTQASIHLGPLTECRILQPQYPEQNLKLRNSPEPSLCPFQGDQLTGGSGMLREFTVPVKRLVLSGWALRRSASFHRVVTRL